MQTISKLLGIAALGMGLLVGSPSWLTAEESSSEHEGHHPADAATDAEKGKGGETTEADDKKSGGGMMGGDHMQKMMKMMQEMHGKMTGQPKGDTGPSSLALNGIAQRMQQDMAITYTGNADVDFVKGMIPHHKAAVDMAKTVLAFGNDPEIKKLAEDVIKTNDAEITAMTEWLKKQGAQK